MPIPQLNLSRTALISEPCFPIKLPANALSNINVFFAGSRLDMFSLANEFAPHFLPPQNSKLCVEKCSKPS